MHHRPRFVGGEYQVGGRHTVALGGRRELDTASADHGTTVLSEHDRSIDDHQLALVTLNRVRWLYRRSRADRMELQRAQVVPRHVAAPTGRAELSVRQSGQRTAVRGALAPRRSAHSYRFVRHVGDFIHGQARGCRPPSVAPRGVEQGPVHRILEPVARIAPTNERSGTEHTVRLHGSKDADIPVVVAHDPDRRAVSEQLRCSTLGWNGQLLLGRLGSNRGDSSFPDRRCDSDHTPSATASAATAAIAVGRRLDRRRGTAKVSGTASPRAEA